MSDSSENAPDDPQPIHGQVRYSQVSARVPKDVGEGCFASAVMVMTGPFETVLDFIQRLSEKPRVVARVVLPPAVVGQFVEALSRNMALYERSFGPMPKPPQMQQPPEAAPAPPATEPAEQTGITAGDELPLDQPGESPPWTTHLPDPDLQEPGLAAPTSTSIEQIYEDLRLPDELLSGRYANAVLIRHSPTEFCFDFITNIFPRSAVSSRVYLAAANVEGMLHSLKRSLGPRPGS